MTPESLPILQAVSSPGVGGREWVPTLLARAQRARGHRVWLAARPGTLAAGLAAARGVPMRAFAPGGQLDLGAAWHLARFLRRERIAVVHAHWSRDLPTLITAARLAGRVPVVLSKHVYSTVSKRDPWHSWWYRRTAAVAAVSRLVQDNLAATTRIPPERLQTIYPGLDLRGEWSTEAVLPDLRPEFGVPPDAPVVGYAGRLNAGKGPHLLLDAFLGLAARHPAWHLVLVGSAVGGGEEAYAAGLRARAEASPAAARIHFAPYRLDMPAVYRSWEVAVCASSFESLGLVAVEAMAMGRAVAAPDAGGFSEIIRPGESGELYLPGDAQDLARVLDRLFADARRRRDLGRRARAAVLERFDLEQTLDRYEALYRRVIAAADA